PVLYDQVVIISVLNDGGGPPCVRMYTTAMSVAVKTMPNSSATVAIGNWSGSVTDANFRRPVAPSIAAASSTSFGIDARPARKITTANGMSRQACTAITEAIAHFAVQRAPGPVREAEVHGESERRRDERRDEDDGGRDQERGKEDRALEDIRPAPPPRPCLSNGFHRDAHSIPRAQLS